MRNCKRTKLAQILKTYELNIKENEYSYREQLLRLFEDRRVKK